MLGTRLRDRISAVKDLQSSMGFRSIHRQDKHISRKKMNRALFKNTIVSHRRMHLIFLGCISFGGGCGNRNCVLQEGAMFQV